MSKQEENFDNVTHEGVENEMTVTLTLDDGSELECIVLTIFPVGEQQYIALLPITEEEEEESEVFLYRFLESSDGELDLQNIESDEEYEAVTEAFDEFLDAQEFDEMMADEDDIEEDEEEA